MSSITMLSVQKIATQRPRFHQALARVKTKISPPAPRRIGFVMLLTALVALPWSSCQAVGSFQTRPAFAIVTRGDDSPLPPATTQPTVSVSAFFGRCGKGRVSDPQTHGCRGPADIR
jgi:hypothetical protein